VQAQSSVPAPTTPRPLRLALGLALVSVVALASAEEPAPSPSRRAFDVVETTIADIHAAMRAKELTCRELVDSYLARIEAYDKRGPVLNALVVVNPAARDLADELDRRFTAGGFVGPLHCVATIVKDNFEVAGLQSTAGSKALAGFTSDRDAFVVARMKAAGAIVLATSNMAELGFSPYETLSSLHGQTRNPYALDRVPAGSSGGTAAAVAASFATVGLGSDTGNSIRGPAAHTALVGIRSTWGLTSRAGLIPLRHLADVPGPMARTVEDTARVLRVIAGKDAEDPVTARARSLAIPDYVASLSQEHGKSARVGILHQAYERSSADGEVLGVFDKAIEHIRKSCAAIVDDVTIPHVERPRASLTCRGFRYDLDEYLATRGRRAPVRTLQELFVSGRFGPTIRKRLEHAMDARSHGPDSEECNAKMAYREAFAAAITEVMDEHRLDVLVYPTWSNPPRMIGDLSSPHGDNSQIFAPSSGFPAINVPMGYTRNDRLPAGLTLLGRAWDEATLIRLASCYELATKHRRPPPSTPALD
jgi:Asp-tRNA(Asn)/Glu-tRNA(Gln) amidotransferase A subunit family amidase